MPWPPTATRPVSARRARVRSNHDFWDPHQAKNLQTAETALPGARVLNLGYDSRPGDMMAVFVVNHGT